jgi:hypothetical protein
LPLRCKEKQLRLLSEKLTGEQRRAIDWTLVAVGALTRIPLAVQLLAADE